MKTLVIAEHDNQQLKPATLSVISAAKKLGHEIDLVIAGFECAAVASAAQTLDGIATIHLADAKHLQYQLPEEVASVITSITAATGIATQYSHILTAASTAGKNLLPRIAALLDVQAISDVQTIIDNDTFERPIYAGNVIVTVRSSDVIKALTIRTTAFDPSACEGGNGIIAHLELPAALGISQFESEALAKSERPELTAAKVVISGGRGLGSAENFDLLYSLADKLGAAVGASRAAVDAGFVPNDLQVGQTGKIVAPELYIAVGISGAIQHLAGMKDSKVIVAINKDPDAAIFQVADFGLVADLFDAIPEINQKL
ncbi:MAG: FAD-binding protein [Marinagarivorans sp.]|nr:FAD-binding protein [Marinagarivorans sp.]